MPAPRINKLTHLNKYSWSILVAYICAILAMQYRVANISLAGFFHTLPLIIIALYYCGKLAPLISQPEQKLKKFELFTRDLFILSFSFLLGCLISIAFSYKNSDVKGWWPLIVYFITLYGLFFSLFFSTAALLIKNHKKYTIVFSLLILLLVSMGKVFPSYMFIPLLGYIDTFYAITFSLLVLHCLFAINYIMIKFFQCRNDTPQ
ncbi:Uncharacterised protein (plasmid) [Legionella adelaidensis]|uniref:Transmembrane protein n=1 Tax=Legionella adelaidensis TaxID=45056 RepID=A0A0W0R3Z4_9GAMM|nr:hypothetical protein [Legionella adelaidensis]KTC65754.1 hypothetical protein Lade_0412 [Legionella adelaidensis]VEH85080.1 Uncharacterised protein [Legionella adelaidensis]